jgi:DNA topoisomerase-1
MTNGNKIVNNKNSPKLTNPKIVLYKKHKNSSGNYLSYSLDKSGKKQYQYPQDFVDKQTKIKFRRIKAFSKIYDKLVIKVRRKLLSGSFENTKELECYLLIYILLRTYFRTGNDNSNNYGLTTLEPRHVLTRVPDIVIFDFIGKKSVRNYKTISDQLMYKYITYLKKTTGSQKGKDQLFSVNAHELNNFLKTLIGPEFICKDIRTYSANKVFIEYLIKNKTLKGSYDHVASQLCNTKYISRKNYVMNSIEDLFKRKPELFTNNSTQGVLGIFEKLPG